MTTPQSRLLKLADEAVADYNATHAAGGEAVYPSWVEDVRLLCNATPEQIEIEPTHWMPRPAFPDCAAPGISTVEDAQDERQAFEAWAEDQGFVLDCDFFEVSGQYYDQDDTQLAYDIWRAARASDPAPAAGDALALLDHPLLRDVLGYIEDAGPADVWGAAQSWMSLRDVALAAQRKGDA